MTRPVLTQRHLNRVLLDRQMLLERSAAPLVEVTERMGGIQSQYAPAAYIGLWSRMRAFERPMLTRALEERRLVQGTLMRATIHVVSAADYWPMTIGIRRVRREWFEKVARREIARLDVDAVIAAVREELGAGPRSMRELMDRIVARGLPADAARWAGTWVDLVRVPPSGTWERRRADLYGLADAWLPPSREVTEDEGIEHLVRRYLGAFGPAPVKDIATWMGFNVSQMRHVATTIGLRELGDEAGGALLDRPDAPLVDPDVPAPPRFLAVWDAALLVHARRTQILPEAYRPLVFNTKTPHSVNTFLLDGQVAGSWRFEDDEIRLHPFRQLSRAELADLEAEAHRLAELHR